MLDGELTSGTLTTFLLYGIQIGGALAGLAGLFGSLMQAIGATERVFKLVDRVPELPPDGERTMVLCGCGSIQVLGVSLSCRRHEAGSHKGLH